MFEREYMPTDVHAINVYAYVCIITHVKKYLYVHIVHIQTEKLVVNRVEWQMYA